MTDKPPKRRRWFQFRLRTLLVAILVLSLSLSWFAAKLARVRTQQTAARSIQNAGGKIEYDWQLLYPYNQPPLPNWLQEIVGNDFYADLVVVDFTPNLKSASTVCNDDLESLKRLTKVHSLYLRDTQVTDDGLHCIAGLSELFFLDLSNTKITDDGLSHLTNLRRLSRLTLVGTNVTDDGTAKLKDALPRCTIVTGYRSNGCGVVTEIVAE